MLADFGAAIGGGTLVALGSAMPMEGVPSFFFGFERPHGGRSPARNAAPR